MCLVYKKNVTRDKYQAVPIKDMPCFKKKTKVDVKFKIDNDEMCKLFITKLPDAALTRHRYVYHHT